MFFGFFSLNGFFALLGIFTATLFVTVFALDIASGWPFWRASLLFDVSGVMCGAVLAYLTWDVVRDRPRGRTQ